ncbi:cadherin-like domain-containing protein [Vibrio sp. Isolate25]|uniref:VCBS domain-containing protein n=1 Tax=Vibrio sp. Isolate25 TaxID=2908535 RepID=UPI001EFE2B74|nr:cadherin-like domain-containing protein [Vibrio sp. Isolate25]
MSSEVQLNSGKEDIAQTITAADLLANTIDVDHNDQGQLSIANLIADHGSIKDNQDGTYTFTPDKDYNGQVHFTYDVKDAHSGVTHTGANMTLAPQDDAATIGGKDTGDVTEDHNLASSVSGLAGQLDTYGTLTVTDPDAGQSEFDAKLLANSYHTQLGGRLYINDRGDWGYSIDNSKPAIQQLGQVSGLAGQLDTYGTLTVTDPDAGQSEFDAKLLANSYHTQLGGRLYINDRGDWGYSIDNSKPAIQQLGQNETLTDTVTVHSKDGTTHDIVITIHGTNDAPTISSEVQLNSGKEDIAQTITARELLANAVDVDDNDQGQLSIANLVADHGSIKDNHDGTYTFTPDKDYNGQVHFTYDVKDAHSGVTHTGANMTLAPVSDAATISGTDTGSITEDRHVFHDSMHQIQVTGTLHVTDSDVNENYFRESGIFGHEKAISDPFQGEMHIDRYGNWDYVLANGNPAVQALKQGETKDVMYEVHSADGTPHRITITVTGTNDAPTVSSSVTLAAGKEDTAVTLQASDLLAHASDIDHDAQLSIHSLSADHGQVTDNHDGTFRFTPDKDYTGPVQFSYQIQDEHGASVQQTASMNLAAAPDNATINYAPSDKHLNGVTEDRNYIDAHDKLHFSGKLDIIDPDKGEAQFNINLGPQTYQGIGYDTKLGGHIVISQDGGYLYTIKDHQPLIQNLANGEVITDECVVKSQDGTSFTIQVNIHGTNDAPTLTAQSHAVTEDGKRLTGQMQGHDTDHGATLTYSIAQPIDGLTFNPDGSYSFDPTNAAYQHLTSGQKDTLTIPVTVIDEHGASATQNLEIVITGTNDAAIINGPTSVNVTEDKVFIYSVNELWSGWNNLDIHDPDSPLQEKVVGVIVNGVTHTLTPNFAGIITATYGTFNFTHGYDGHNKWGYMANNDHANIQGLSTGESLSDSMIIITEDGTHIPFTAVIRGTDDHIIIDTPNSLTAPIGSVTEDITPRVSGQLQAHDVDTIDKVSFTAGQFVGRYGTLNVNSDGHWHYDLDPTKANSLEEGEFKAEGFNITATSTDGSKATERIQINIFGTNDAPTVSAEVHLRSGKEDTVQTITTAELLTNANDVDHNDQGQLSIANLVADHGSVKDNHDGTYTFTPDKDYNGQVHFTYDVKDTNGGEVRTGASTTLLPTNDAAVFSGQDTGDVAEDYKPNASVVGNYSYTIQAHGMLTAADSDLGESGFEFNTLISAPMHPEWAPYTSSLGGKLEIGPKGDWGYYIDNRKPEIQQLGENETLTDTVTVHSKDGTTHDIVITIHGTNDAPTVSSEVQLNSGKEDTVQTITASDLLANARDIDSNDKGQLSVDNLVADHGSIRDNQDGTYTFTPNKGYNGQVHFTYDVQDAHSGATHASARMTLTSLAPTPVSQSDETVDQQVPTVDVILSPDDVTDEQTAPPTGEGNSHHGAAAYLSALGLNSEQASTETSSPSDLPNDIDIVMAQEEHTELQEHAVDTDMLEPKHDQTNDSDNKHQDLINPDEHHDHTDPSHLIDPY